MGCRRHSRKAPNQPLSRNPSPPSFPQSPESTPFSQSLAPVILAKAGIHPLPSAIPRPRHSGEAPNQPLSRNPPPPSFPQSPESTPFSQSLAAVIPAKPRINPFLAIPRPRHSRKAPNQPLSRNPSPPSFPQSPESTPFSQSLAPVILAKAGIHPLLSAIPRPRHSRKAPNQPLSRNPSPPSFWRRPESIPFSPALSRTRYIIESEPDASRWLLMNEEGPG